MSKVLRCGLLGSVAVAMSLAVHTSAYAADDYPSKPISMIVAFSAGGATDTLARALAEPLSTALGQPVVVENQPGASGYIAWRNVADADPDGYTIHFTGNAVALNTALRPDEPLDPRAVFDPIGRAGTAPMAFVTYKGLEPDTLEEFVAYASAVPDGINFASSGIGSVSHMTFEALAVHLGLEPVHIPYSGGGESNAALIGGHVDAMLTNIGAAIRSHEEDTVKVLAVTSTERSPKLPDVPTLAELGIEPNVDLRFFWGLYVPAGTPEPIKAELQDALQTVLEDPAVVERLAGLEVDADFAPADVMAETLDREVRNWRAFVEQRGIRPE